MVIGGVALFASGTETYIYNADTDAWTPGPYLKHHRHHHACAGMNLGGKYRHAKNINITVSTLNSEVLKIK